MGEEGGRDEGRDGEREEGGGAADSPARAQEREEQEEAGRAGERGQNEWLQPRHTISFHFEKPK